MKNLRWAVAVAAVSAISAPVCLLVSGCAKKDAKAQAQADLQKFYNEENAAMAKKDAAGVFAHYAPDFTSISATGKTQGLAKTQADMTEVFAMPFEQPHYTTTIHQVTLNDANGTQVSVDASKQGTTTLRDPQSGRTGALAMDTEVRDFWVKGTNGWQLKREKLLSLQGTLNGKPLGKH